MRIESRHLEAILARARAGYPFEVCGVLLGREEAAGQPDTGVPHHRRPTDGRVVEQVVGELVVQSAGLVAAGIPRRRRNVPLGRLTEGEKVENECVLCLGRHKILRNELT